MKTEPLLSGGARDTVSQRKREHWGASCRAPRCWWCSYDAWHDRLTDLTVFRVLTFLAFGARIKPADEIFDVHTGTGEAKYSRHERVCCGTCSSHQCGRVWTGIAAILTCYVWAFMLYLLAIEWKAWGPDNPKVWAMELAVLFAELSAMTAWFFFAKYARTRDFSLRLIALSPAQRRRLNLILIVGCINLAIFCLLDLGFGYMESYGVRCSAVCVCVLLLRHSQSWWWW